MSELDVKREDGPTGGRYLVTVEGHTAEMTYSKAGATRIIIDHTGVPDALRGKYQCYTQADLTALRATGCTHAFADVQSGVAQYVRWLADSGQH